LNILLTESELSEIDDKLSFHKDPVFEKSDIECVLFAFRTYGPDALDWLQTRRSLFISKELIPYLLKLIRAVKEKR
jgi:hypothetical protein